jgi:hypothetical protein
MAFLIRVSVFVLAGLLLAGCDKKAAPPAPLTALTRPVLTLDAQAGRLLVPQTALVERGGVPGVFVLNEENQARFRMVRTGKNLNDRVEILSGLSGSETLVVGDLHDVQDGSPIRPPWMAEVPGAKPSVNEASFTGQTQEQFSGQKK